MNPAININLVRAVRHFRDAHRSHLEAIERHRTDPTSLDALRAAKEAEDAALDRMFLTLNAVYSPKAQRKLFELFSIPS